MMQERRRAHRMEINRLPLCWALGCMEGSLAGLVVLVPTLAYHNLFTGMTMQAYAWLLYVAYAGVAGVIYGASSALSASRFLDDIQAQQRGLADSVMGWTIAFAVAIFLAFLFDLIGEYSRVSLSSAYVLGILLLLGVRGTAYAALRTKVHLGRLQYRRIGVIGSKIDIDRFLVRGQLWRAGFGHSGSMSLETIQNIDFSLRKDIIRETAQRWVALGTHYVVVIGELDDIDAFERIANEFKRFSVSVIGIPATENTSLRFLDVVPMGSTGGVRVLRAPLSQFSVLLKRSFDLCGAIGGLVVLFPMFVLTAIAIKLESKGPVFYLQARRGFNGKSFLIWKFRSMSVTEPGDAMTQARLGDARITRVGAIIRSTSIDELPQFFNVLKGDMSLIGPRPHALLHDGELEQQLETYAHRQRIKPGITGWAQINGFRGAISSLSQIKNRTEHDLYYIENWTFFFDCWILLMTIFSKKVRTNAF